MDSHLIVFLMTILVEATALTQLRTVLPQQGPSSLGLNVCGSCRWFDAVYECCSGWTNGENDEPDCLTPVCSPPCANGLCTSPNVCTCAVGFVGGICDEESRNQFDARLLHGQASNQGIVQIRSQTGTWEFINAANWTPSNSHVVCLQLGHSFASIQSRGTWNTLDFPEANSSIANIAFECTGEEESLDNCIVLDLEEESQGNQIVAVKCEDYDPAQFQRNRCGSTCIQETLTRTGCKCDPFCVNYDDCCHDHATNNCSIGRIFPIDETCTPMPLYHKPPFDIPSDAEVGYFLISQCSDSWPWQDDDIALQCTNVPNEMDPLTFTPVQEITFEDARNIYRNVFCALCNYEDLQNLQAWKLVVHTTTEDHVTILDVGPPGDTQTPRTCYLNLEIVANCRRRHDNVREGCATYYEPFVLETKVFRNKFCAVCSGAYPLNVTVFDQYLNLPVVKDESNIDCNRIDPPSVCASCNIPGAAPGPDPGLAPRPAPEPEPEPDLWPGIWPDLGPIGTTQPPKRFIPELLTLFDFGDTDNICDHGEVFDHFTQDCRLLSCPLNYRLSNGKCVAIRIDSPPVDRVLPTAIPSVLDDYAQCIKAAWMEQFGDGYQYRDNSTTTAIHVTLHSDRITVHVDKELTNSTLSGLNNMFLSLRNSSVVEHLFCNVSTLNFSFNDTYHGQTYATDNTCVRSITPGDCVSVDSIKLNGNNNTADLINYSWDENKECYVVSLIWNVCNDSNDVIPPCPEIEIGPDEYEIIVTSNSTTILHKESGQIIPSEKFELGENGTLKVCYSYFHPQASKFQEVLNYATFACLILSIVATFMTFLSYCVFKQLRNITGYIIVNFLVAFFVAQVMFLISPRLNNPTNRCITSAILTQFFWLASFFWMNAVSLITTSTMNRSTLVRNKSIEMGVLVRYFVYAWGGPLVIAGVGVTLHFCDCTDIAPIYGRKDASICWLIGHNGFATLWGFSAPVAALLLFNLTLFVYAAITFHRKLASGSTTKTSSKRIKMEMAIYVKLTILMGLPWLLGFILTIVDSIILNYIYSILNSLQGVFIFWALVLTGRAGKLWRQKMCGRKQGSRSTDVSSKNDKLTVKTVSTSFMTPSTSNVESAANEYNY